MSNTKSLLDQVAELEGEAQTRFQEVAKGLHDGRVISPTAILEALRAAGRTRADLEAAVNDLAELAELVALEAESGRLDARNTELRQLVAKHAANLERQKAEQAKIVAKFEAAHTEIIAPLNDEIQQNEAASKEARDAHRELTTSRTPDARLEEWGKFGGDNYQRMIDRVLEAREAREQKRNPKPWTAPEAPIHIPRPITGAAILEARDGGWTETK